MRQTSDWVFLYRSAPRSSKLREYLNVPIRWTCCFHITLNGSRVDRLCLALRYLCRVGSPVYFPNINDALSLNGPGAWAAGGRPSKMTWNKGSNGYSTSGADIGHNAVVACRCCDRRSQERTRFNIMESVFPEVTGSGSTVAIEVLWLDVFLNDISKTDGPGVLLKYACFGTLGARR